VSPEPTHDELAKLFPSFGVRVYEQDLIPSGITDRTARDILSKVGLPTFVTSAINFNFRGNEELMLKPTEVLFEEDCPPNIRGLFLLGLWSLSQIVLDGISGDVLLVDRQGGRRRMATDLRTLVLCLRFMQKEVFFVAASDEQPPEILTERLVAGFSSIDPTVAAESEDIWREVVQELLLE
jgi:hypothetical protein